MPADSGVSPMTASDRQLYRQQATDNSFPRWSAPIAMDKCIRTSFHQVLACNPPQHRQNAAVLFGDRLELQRRLPNIHNSLYRNPCRQPVTQNTYFRRIGSYHPAWRRKDRGDRISWRVRSQYYLLQSGWIQRADAQPRRGPVMAAHSKQTGKW